MRTVKSPFLDFVRLVVKGETKEVSRRSRPVPHWPPTPAVVGASRQVAREFFFTEIAHYLYAGDTALHMAAAAFQRPIAKLLVAHGADCHARNRRGAQPLHYAADANHWDPAAQAETIEYLLSIGADPNALDQSGVAPLHRAVRTRSLPAVRALLDGGANPRVAETRPAQRPCTSPFRPPAAAEAVPSTHESSRRASSSYCWNAAHAQPTRTGEANRFDRLRRVIGFCALLIEASGVARNRPC